MDPEKNQFSSVAPRWNEVEDEARTLPVLRAVALLNTQVLEVISETVVAVPAAGVVGLFVGSFLNVVVYRTPRGLSVVAPRSFCPTCDRQLEWWENVPLVSWIVLRGQCRTCHERISVRYPMVELITGITFAFVTWGWHGKAPAIGYCGLAATLITIACVEYGGLRSPLSIAAIGVAVSEGALLLAAGLQQHWRLGVGSVIGLALAAILYGLLRTRDPECADRRGHGRSALLVAGVWIGGLGTVPIAVGIGVSVGIYLACLAVGQPRQANPPNRAHVGPSRTALPSVVVVPLVTAIGAGLAVSLIIAR